MDNRLERLKKPNNRRKEQEQMDLMVLLTKHLLNSINTFKLDMKSVKLMKPIIFLLKIHLL